MEHVPLDRRGDVELARQRGAVEARQHGDGDDEWPGHAESLGGFGGAVGSGAHHGAAARGMDVEHEDAQPDGLTRRTLHGVRDVVELEVEKDFAAPLPDRLDRPGSLGREELRADLEARHLAGERIHEAGRAVERVDVERDY